MLDRFLMGPNKAPNEPQTVVSKHMPKEICTQFYDDFHIVEV